MAGTSTAAASGETKPATKVTITTPPLAGTRRRTSSGTFRGTSQRARVEEWEKMTGASLASRASCMVDGATCERSTSIPIRFISRTTSRPKAERPSWRGASVAESAQSLVLLWVRVM